MDSVERLLSDAMSVLAGQDARSPLSPEKSEQFEEALRALEVYKKKDPSKGAFPSHICAVCMLMVSSRRSVQGSGERPDNETELLQDHVFKSFSGCYPFFAQGAWVDGRRASCT